jgi:hypothetical protein
MKKRSQRVIEKLRKLYPGNWRYDKDLKVWIGPEFEVRAYSVLNNQYDGDESSHTRYVEPTLKNQSSSMM